MTDKTSDLRSRLSACRVVPVVVVEDAATAVPTARALLEGGITAIEIVLRTDAAYDAVKTVRADVPEIALGVGSVFHSNQVEFCAEVGADFIVTPGTTEALYDAVAETDLILVPGTATLSEALRALERGWDLVKFFPAEASGGASALKAIGGPLPDVTFMPTGGITPATAPDYLALPNVLCVGGSWITKSTDPATISKLAKDAVGL